MNFIDLNTVYVLIGCIGVSALFHTDDKRFDILYFIAVCWAMSAIGYFVSAEFYGWHYILCMFLNCIITCILARSHKVSKINVSLQIICLVFVYLNLFAFYCHFNNIKGAAEHYNLACERVYYLAFLLSIGTWSVDVLGKLTNNRVSRFFYRNISCRSLQLSFDKEAT